MTVSYVTDRSDQGFGLAIGRKTGTVSNSLHVEMAVFQIKGTRKWMESQQMSQPMIWQQQLQAARVAVGKTRDGHVAKWAHNYATVLEVSVGMRGVTSSNKG